MAQFEVMMMARGGARNRSGPAKDPESEKSISAGYSLTALPAEGYKGRTPAYPLEKRIFTKYVTLKDGRQVLRQDTAKIKKVWEREQAIWKWLWTTPQACAWSMPSESWRLMTIAMYARTFVICESSTATAADKNSLHRFADQIGLTTAGLAEMGWKVAINEVAEKKEQKAKKQTAAKTGSKNRLKIVKADGQ